MKRGEDNISDSGEREIQYNGPEDWQRGLEALPSRTSPSYRPSVLSRSASRVSFHPHPRNVATRHR